jgi:flagellin
VGLSEATTANGTDAASFQINTFNATGVETNHTITFANSITASTSVTNVLAALNGASGLNGLGAQAIYNDATGAIEIQSLASGALAGVSVGTGTAAAVLGLNSSGSTSAEVTGTSTNASMASIVSTLNTAAQKALGTSTSANIFSLSATNQIVINSQTKGASSAIELTLGSGNTTTPALSEALGLTSNATEPTLVAPISLGAGAGPTTSSIASMLQQAFNNPSNSTLQQAGLQASGVDGGALTVSSSNGTNFRIDEYGSVGANLGFGISGGSFTGLTSGASGASMIDAGGTSALGTGTVQNPYLSFAPMKFGSDTQAITISANSAAGVSQPPVTITLQNNGTAQTGATIDSAVSYINSQLRQSNNPTMQSIVAVEENVGGTEQINFLSSSPSFSVSVGNSVNGDGLNAGTAKTFNSVTNGSAGTASIDTLAGAQAAVTAVSAAVAQLGTAQAAVGIGENQVNYAVNLAQSQITNISSAESQIRDANVAQQAANMTKASVLQQATIAAMAQANQEPQAVLSLLKQ